ncbi:MAG: zf-TFIIB domain-containing protein [Polyangiaceae bacterium]
MVRMAPQGTFLSGATSLDRRLAGQVADAVVYLFVAGKAPAEIRAALDPRIEPARSDQEKASQGEVEQPAAPAVTSPDDAARTEEKRRRGRRRDGAFPRCPRCERKLERHRGSGLEVDICRRCGGVWADNALSQRLVARPELEAVALAEAVASEAVRRSRRDAPAPCPVCDRVMRATAVPRQGIVVDFCTEHGTWFDRDELQRVNRRFAAAGAAGDNAGSSGGVHARGAAMIGASALRGLLAAAVDDDD